MKKLIIFILMVGLANVTFARTDDAKNSQIGLHKFRA